MGDLRLMGQEVSIRVIQNGSVLATINYVASFNDNAKSTIIEDNFLGRPSTDLDSIFDHFTGDFEIQVYTSSWNQIVEAHIAKASRKQLGTVFNIVRTDFFADGTSTVYTYVDVKWGEFPTTVAGRKEKVKVKMNFACEERKTLNNQLP